MVMLMMLAVAARTAPAATTTTTTPYYYYYYYHNRNHHGRIRKIQCSEDSQAVPALPPGKCTLKMGKVLGSVECSVVGSGMFEQAAEGRS